MDAPFLDIEYFGLTVAAWLRLIGLWVLLTLAGLFIRRISFGRFERLAERTDNRIDDVIAALLRGTRVWFIAIVALYLAVSLRTEDAPIFPTIERIVFLGLIVQFGLWGNALIRMAAEWYTTRREDDAAQITAARALGLVGKIVLWSVVFLMALDNFGVDITALVAGLGIGGIAVALAVQNVLQDILAYVSIVADQPFVYGDFLVIDDLSGTVEHIGVKTTRIRSLSGEQLVFSNNDLLSSRVRNYKRMNERRIVFSVGVEYDTPHEKLKAIPDVLRTCVEEQENVRFDRSHLKTFGDFSINFETVYYMLVPEYNVYMDTQQAINLSIHRRFEQEGIVFAFPTQTIHLAKDETESA
ncbi:MAG: mechanosensitive ion channel family protein [Rhodothermales bacterium]|nr:mechanosensitive ion channel family protein [Rhodothermales bacterium]